MTERLRPTRVPAKSAARKPQNSEASVECRDCGWALRDDLTLTWVLGMPLTLCSNPWACWERQIDLGEQLGTRAGD